ncbi:MAG: tRNA preQ1(34) S-adenosylmethionine ribosyltransferase-isomerase QueA, partial [Deltaproteobacteria bacterium]|nr:tRNA preQ1(34) S-adenosylmethionine ribosyltransferase-isomerase QueA [Deltaproteobacteria bacterium]
CLLKSRRKVVEAARLSFGQSLQAEVLQPLPGGKWQVRLECPGSFEAALQEAGSTPLPPYIRRGRGDQRDESDRRRYQTVYARCDGAVAAPTAGLHFTPELMERVQGMGASFSFVTLHVGYGTFQPIRQEVVEEHAMHYEFYQVDGSCADAVNGARTSSGRVIAVGTTATRVLETVASSDGRLAPAEGSTDLYVYPGYRFKAVDAMITNFHLPMSSLLLLVSAFAGREFVLQAYREAIEHKYRFFSYGDAMLIL